MSHHFEVSVRVRSDLGKGASRRMRRLEDRVPAILYGAGKAPEPLSVDHKKFLKLLENKASYAHILTLIFDDGTRQSAILKDLQRHAFKPRLEHIDFLRVDQTHKIHLRVPLLFLNEGLCKGVKMGGGTLHHHLTEVEIACLPQHLPEQIEVDIADLEVGRTLHLSDLKLPEGVHLVGLHEAGSPSDAPVVNVTAPRGAKDAEEEGAGSGTKPSA